MKVLHVLDHSLPMISGYSMRSHCIVRFQRDHGLDPVVVTSPKHVAVCPEREVLDGIVHHRVLTTKNRMTRTPYIWEIALMMRMAQRIAAIAVEEKAQILHAHSPVLNGLPALWAARRLRIPPSRRLRVLRSPPTPGGGPPCRRVAHRSPGSRWRVAALRVPEHGSHL